jgi:hypothetical protein
MSKWLGFQIVTDVNLKMLQRYLDKAGSSFTQEYRFAIANSQQFDLFSSLIILQIKMSIAPNGPEATHAHMNRMRPRKKRFWRVFSRITIVIGYGDESEQLFGSSVAKLCQGNWPSAKRSRGGDWNNGSTDRSSSLSF